MAITVTSPHNGAYLEIYGSFSGTYNTTFQVGIEADGQWWWRSKSEETGAWTAKDENNTLTVNTEYDLTSGVKIKFTRSSAGTYNYGDMWSWMCFTSLSLSSNAGQYTDIHALEIGQENDLIAFSQSTGDISVIKNFDGDTPLIRQGVGNIGQGSSIDIERRNKSLYVATGKGTPPKWLGYVNYSTFDGPTPEPEFFSGNAMDVIQSAESPTFDAFDVSVVLRGSGGANTKDSKIIAGIKFGEQKLFVYNIAETKLFSFNLGRDPLMIHKAPHINSGSSNYYTQGVAVLCSRSAEDTVGVLQIWKIATDGTIEGQNTNKMGDYPLKAPTGLGSSQAGDRVMTQVTDFCIVPKKSDFSQNTADADWKLYICAKECAPGENGITNQGGSWEKTNYPWIWYNDNWKGNAYGEKIQGWVDVTPKFDFSDETWGFDENYSNPTEEHGAWYYLAESPNYDPNAPGSGYDLQQQLQNYLVMAGLGASVPNQNIEALPEVHQLEFGGWDSNGANPTVMFTTRVRSPEKLMNVNLQQYGVKAFNKGYWNNSNSNYSYWWSELLDMSIYGPFYRDDKTTGVFATLFKNMDAKLYGCKWVTWNIGWGTSGRHKTPMLMHTTDWDDTREVAEQWESNTGFSAPEHLLSGSGRQWAKTVVPSSRPLYCANKEKGGFYIWGNKDDDKARQGMIYQRAGNRRLLNFKCSVETSDTNSHFSDADKPHLFPNFYSGAYTAMGLTAGSVLYRKIPPFTGLTGAGVNDDKNRWRVCQGSYYYDLASNNQGSGSFPNLTNEKAFAMGIVSGDANSPSFIKTYIGSSGMNNETDEFANETGWLTFSSASANAGIDWIGPTCKTVFYRISIIYDGYQETALLDRRETLTSSSDIAGQVEFQVKINDAYPLSKRIASIAVYRGTHPDQNADEPNSLYRFVTEVPLLQFNHDATNNVWYADIFDNGDTEGSYEAINGVSEVMHSLHLNYTCNTQQNGYHFVANAHHTQIDNAENFIFRSLPGKFSLFDWSKDIVQLSFVPVALKGFMGKVYAFGKSNIAVVNPETLQIEDEIEGIGCISPKHIMVSDAGLFWVDYKNCYIASPSIQSVGDAMTSVDTWGWNNLTTQIKDASRISYDALRKAFLVFFTSGTDYRCWAYSLKYQRWDLWETPDKVLSTTVTKDGYPCLLLNNQKIVKYLAGSNHKDWIWESKKLTMNNDMLDKKFRNIKLEASSRAKTTLKYKVDGSSAWEDGTDISSSFTGSNNRAVKIDASDNKNRWIELQGTGDNGVSGSNVKGFAFSTIYKPKRPK
jgi:hypothetical protein